MRVVIYVVAFVVIGSPLSDNAEDDKDHYQIDSRTEVVMMVEAVWKMK